MAELIKSWFAILSVLALTIVLSWPYLIPDQAPFAAQEDRATDIQSSLPVIAEYTPLPRDPFAAQQPLRTRDSQAPLENVAESAPEPDPAQVAFEELIQTLRSWELNGTVIQGDSRFAIINGQLFEVHTSVLDETPTGTPVMLAQVRPDNIVLTYESHIWELGYPDAPQSSDENQEVADDTAPAQTKYINALQRQP